MKTKLFTTILMFVTINVVSQITITDNDIIDVGDNIYQAIDHGNGSNMQIGPAGANQNWDFSNLQEDEVNIIEHVDPSSTSFGFMHPTSNICAQDDGENIYFKKSSTAVEIVGFDDQPLINPILALPLPLTYPMQFSTGSILAVSESQENSFIPDSLALLASFGTAHKIDSLKIDIAFESSYNVDGYGDVIIPMGTFSSLRLSVVSTNTTNAYLYCTDTLSGVNSGWYPAPQQLLQTLGMSPTETDYFYQWWSNDPAVKFTLVNIDVDAAGVALGEIQFLSNNTTSIEKQNILQFSVYPVPATYRLIIEGKENTATNLILRDINGKIILDNKFNTSTTLSLEGIAKGIYHLILKTANGELIKKVIVE